MLERAASNGREITREDFYNIMTKKTFWVSWKIFNIFFHFIEFKKIKKIKNSNNYFFTILL